MKRNLVYSNYQAVQAVQAVQACQKSDVRCAACSGKACQKVMPEWHILMIWCPLLGQNGISLYVSLIQMLNEHKKELPQPPG